MKVAVIGAGAIGGWLAAGFVRSGAEVRVLARGATLEALQRSGLIVAEGAQRESLAIHATSSPEALRDADVLVLGVKAHDLPGLAPVIAAVLGPDTTVVPAINGLPWWFFEGFGGPARGFRLDSVDPGGVLAALMPSERIVGTVVHAASRVERPGEIHVVKADKVWLGDVGGSGGLAAPVCAALARGGLPAAQTDDIHREVWSKLWGNSNMNPLTALARADASQLLDEPGARALAIAMMREMAALGECIGLTGFEDPEGRIALTRRLGAFRTSMLQDIEAGRAIELAPILGALVELSARLGAKTPIMDGVHALARLLDANLRSGSS